jgi:TolB-like protein/DNA-binding winged helix-turn-helix (wHTH) protein
MDRPTAIPLRIGAWRVDPTSDQVSRDGETVRVEARTMRLLLCLARHAGEVVSIDELLSQAWAGVIVTPDSVYQAITSLRRLLGDDARQPTYIATVPRLGYRLVATVSPWVDPLPAPTDSAMPVEAAASSVPAPRARPRAGVLLGVAVALGLALVAALLFNGDVNRARAVPARSVAVLPFLDLTTQEMNEEYFADGMTEELIDRLSKIPGLRVPAPTASFYFKGKQIALADVAKSLGVTYVLDGSVRKSGAALRIAARLVRADDGYVIWSETYDRPAADKLKVQDEIAGEVTKALTASIR